MNLTNQVKNIAILILLLSCFSCDYFREKQSEPNAIARVGEHYLFKSDIEKILPKNYTLEDSVKIATNYVNNWALKKLLLIKANENISNDKKIEFEELVEQYRTDLYTQTYMEMLVNKQIDTIISTKEKEHFYQENKNIFKLNEDLIKLRYIHLQENDFPIKNVIEEFRRFNKNDKKQLDSLSLHFISTFFNDSTWVKTNDVYNKLPFLKEKLGEKSGELNFFLEQKDSTGAYLIKINHLLRKNNDAPIQYVQPTLKQIILNKRKLEYTKELENDIINTAIKKKQFELYE